MSATLARIYSSPYATSGEDHVRSVEMPVRRLTGCRAQARSRADVRLDIGTGQAAPFDAITDVDGVLVGHCTLVRGDGPLVRGKGPVRTGVTVVVPHRDGIGDVPLFGGSHVLNGNGEVTGLAWLRESGLLTSPIGLTNTSSVGVVRDTLVALEVESRQDGDEHWSLPVVGETWDGVLNDCDGFHVRAEHVRTAFGAAASGPLAQGIVGGGTGMICHGFKGGIGTASRRAGDYTVGVLVQANQGRRSRLSVSGVPVGQLINEDEVPLPATPGDSAYQLGGGSTYRLGGGSAYQPGSGSIVGIVATDAPLLPHQCDRLAQRAGLGVARTGGAGENSSGDIFVAFATGNRLASRPPGATPTALYDVAMLPNDAIDPLFYAAIEATEQAILNALLAAETMTGRDGVTAHALPPDRLATLLSGL